MAVIEINRSGEHERNVNSNSVNQFGKIEDNCIDINDKESILSIDSWLDDQIINSYILINRYKYNCRYIDFYILTYWKNSNYGKCKFNDDTNLVLMGFNINYSQWHLLVADYKKKQFNKNI